jgi:hypothetical protein
MSIDVNNTNQPAKRRNKRKLRKKKIDKTSKREELMDDVEKITGFTNTNRQNIPTPPGNESQGSVEQDIKILNKAMEKIVLDITELKTSYTLLKQENQWLSNKLDELSHSVGADQNLHEWQVDAAGDGDVIEAPISNGELMRKLNDYADRRVQYNMH